MKGGTRSIVLSTDVGRDAWDRYVDAHPQASAYHAWIWREIFEDAFGHRAVYLAALRGHEVRGVLPLIVFRSWLFGRFLISLPFVNYGGVLSSDDEAADALVAGAVEHAAAEGASYVELRHTMQRFAALPSRAHKVGMMRTLPASREEIWHSLNRKVRNQIRKAERHGLTIVSGGLETLDAFYAVFARNMRDLGTPVYSKRFFASILSRLHGVAAGVVISSGTTPVAAAITVRHRNTMEVPWASALREHRFACPNMLLYWTIVQQAIAAGITRFDFGRSSPDSGPYRFKRQWGAGVEPLHWEYLLSPGQTMPNRDTSNPRLGPAIEAWKRLPLRVATAIGPHIVRSIP